MKRRKIALYALAVVLGLPTVAGLITVGWMSILDDASGQVVTSGRAREYLLYVPPTYDPSTPTPLVISLHSGALWPAHQRNLSGWNRLADEHGFLVVYPSGTAEVLGVAKVWHTFAIGPELSEDVKFIDELIDELQSRYDIDPARIYADGMSNGGGMAFALSCALAQRVAAVGMVAPAQALPPSWCTPSRPVPTVVFHGTADPIVPYDGGPLGIAFAPVETPLPPIRDFVAAQASRNGCAAEPEESAAAPTVTRRAYEHCAGEAEVILYTIDGAGHAWPGGKPLPQWWIGPNTDAIDATSQIWAFFERHPRARDTRP